MTKIMLATDFSERSDRAQRRATLLGRQMGSSLSLVHVVDDDQPRRIVKSECDMASALLQELCSTIKSVDGLQCETRVVLDDPFAGIAAAAIEDQADLLIIGPHRRQMLRDVFVGTTAERTIRSVNCPVLMVNAPPVGAYGRVMFATDFSQQAARAVEACAELGLAHRADTAILHVFDAPAARLAMSHALPADDREAYVGERRDEAARQLAEFVDTIQWHAHHHDLRQILWQDKRGPAEEILKASKDERADLIVIGTRGRTGLSRLLLGSVAEAVLQRADCDVLAVPASAGV